MMDREDIAKLAFLVYPSVVTSKPAIEGHFKTGQRTATRTELVVPRR